MSTVNKSIPSLFGRLTATVFDDYPIYTFNISSELVNDYLPDKLSAFASISWLNSAKRDFFYSKPVIFASRSQLTGQFEELPDSITFEDFLKELLSQKSDIVRYNFVITGDRLVFARIPHTRHISYHILCKHITLTNRSEDVRFGGEFWRDENDILKLNNNSGTYEPSNDLIEKTIQLFDKLTPQLQFQGVSFQTSRRPSTKHRFIYKVRNKLTTKE